MASICKQIKKSIKRRSSLFQTSKNYDSSDIVRYAKYHTKYNFSMRQLVNYIKDTEGKDVNRVNLWNDFHNFLKYLSKKLYVKCMLTLANHRKSGEPRCRTNKEFEKINRSKTHLNVVVGDEKITVKTVIKKIVGFFGNIISKIASLVGSLIKYIGKLLSDNYFGKIFKAFEIWHNNKFGDNYNHSSDEPLLLGEVDEWTGIPLFEATSAGIVL